MTTTATTMEKPAFCIVSTFEHKINNTMTLSAPDIRKLAKIEVPSRKFSSMPTIHVSTMPISIINNNDGDGNNNNAKTNNMCNNNNNNDDVGVNSRENENEILTVGIDAVVAAANTTTITPTTTTANDDDNNNNNGNDNNNIGIKCNPTLIHITPASGSEG